MLTRMTGANFILALTQGQSLFNIGIAAAISFALIGLSLKRLFARRAALPQRPATPRRLSPSTFMIPGFIGLAAAVYTALAELHFDLPGTSLAYLLFALFVGAVSGVVMMARGLIGHRVGDHPYCRKCGFDLFGRPEGTIVCGECGSPLDAKRAIVTGERRRRPFVIAAGLIMAILLPAIGVAATRSHWGEIGQYAADKWLAMRSESSLIADASTSRAAREELFRRSFNGKLSNPGLESMLRADFQRPQLAPIVAGQILEAWDDGKISEGLARQAMLQMLSVRCETGQQAAAGECIRFALCVDDYRLNYSSAFAPLRLYRLDVSNLRVTINGRAVKQDSIRTDNFDLPRFSKALSHLGTSIDLSAFPELQPGNVVRLVIDVHGALVCGTTGRPTLVEERELQFVANVPIVDAAQMWCTPAFETVVDENNPDAAPASQPVTPKAEDWSIRTSTADDGGVALYVSSYSRTAFVGDIVMRVGGRDVVVGQYAERLNDEPDAKLSAAPSADALFILRPNNELGIRLFRTVSTIQKEIVINSQ